MFSSNFHIITASVISFPLLSYHCYFIFIPVLCLFLNYSPDSIIITSLPTLSFRTSHLLPLISFHSLRVFLLFTSIVLALVTYHHCLFSVLSLIHNSPTFASLSNSSFSISVTLLPLHSPSLPSLLSPLFFLFPHPLSFIFRVSSLSLLFSI